MKRFLALLLSCVLLLATTSAFASSESDIDPVMLAMYLGMLSKTGDEEIDTADYGKLNFKSLSRYPDDYVGEKIKVKGTVLQALGGKSDDYYEIRIATDGKYDDVIYVICKYPGFGILEDDTLTLYLEYYGLMSYTTVLGSTNTLPGFVADLVELNE